ncbi:MAG TPA: ATP-binding protein, partial [Candidatus Acidoferrales bacterium]|nr:ATP-binding protein [Candidatus Acidoferrales bacterium]
MPRPHRGLHVVEGVSAGARGAAKRRGGVFVGRSAELDELRGGFDEACRGHGRLFLLVGEPGIGKTRLADEMATHAVAQGAQVLWGRSWESGGAPAFWPWVQILRSCVAGVDAKERAFILASAKELSDLVPELFTAWMHVKL